MSNLHHKPSLQSVAKAFSKSMNAQKIFFFFKVKSSNNEYKENIFVRQREILYTFLFSLYLNDLETFLEKNNVTGLKTLSDELEQELGCCPKEKF
jgi:hypothetical protein